MEYFRKYPETGVTRPDQVAVVGDRLSTDVMMANLMGSYAVWVKDGVVPREETSIVSHICHLEGLLLNPSQFARVEHKFATYLLRRGYEAPEPASPFE